MTEAVEATDLNENNYMKLFMQELTYQDPLKPVDNREFMAQMAQFSSLQEVRATNDHLTKLLGMTSANQCLSLLGKTVTIDQSSEEGIVTSAQFYPEAPPKIVVMIKNKPSQVELQQISSVRS